MFKTTVSPSYSVSVSIDVLGDNGAIQTRVLKCKFKRLNQDEIDEMFEKVNMGQLTDRQVIDQVLIGWEDAVDEEGQSMEFNEENLAKALKVYPTRPTIVKKFFETINFARAKN